MKEQLSISFEEPVIMQGSDCVFGNKSYWCNGSFMPLKMSFLRPRCFYDYDQPKQNLPVILFLCGGGWTEVDHNIWLPEMTWFAKRGYVVASANYSLSPTWIYPEPLLDVKLAIRYLRAHAEELRIDADRIAVMGESAGAYLAALAGTTADMDEFKSGDWSEYSDRPQAVVAFYPPVDMADFEGRGELESYDTDPQFLARGTSEPQSLLAGCTYVRKDPELCKKMDPRTYITPDTPPFLILHGLEDTIVPNYHGRVLYDKLVENNVPADLLLVEGADHACYRFFQPEMKERILAFLNKWLNK